MDLTDLLRREHTIPVADAVAVLDDLIAIWNQNSGQIKAERHDRSSLTDGNVVANDLEKLHRWFNPTATGKRLRETFSDLQTTPEPGMSLGDLIEPIDTHHAVVSPEGRIAMWVLAAGTQGRDLNLDAAEPLWLSQHQIATAWTLLTGTYQDWNRQRLRDVTGLLREETATLRPSVIGLILVLLINRNTSQERRLPASTSQRLSDDITKALAEPALAFVEALSGDRDSRADARGLDVYRGWVIGEIARRLGTGLHREDGIWIDESAVAGAEERLITALLNRPGEQLPVVVAALDILLTEYQRVRPRLTTLGIAFERPSVTLRLIEKVKDRVRDRLSHSSLEALGSDT